MNKKQHDAPSRIRSDHEAVSDQDRALRNHFARLTPNAEQRARMRQHLAMQTPRRRYRKLGWLAAHKRWLLLPAAAILLIWAATLLFPQYGAAPNAYAIHVMLDEENRVLLESRNGGDHEAVISKIDPRPGLEFYVTGENIAAIDITSETEYLYAIDWTQTQHEKHWNDELYSTYDADKQVSIMDESKLYDKQLSMRFDPNFTDYGEIWYRWTAWNMYQWAAADDYAHFYGYGIPIPETATEQERMQLAAAEGTAVGHMQLDDYPDAGKEDRITITVTDHDGRVSTQTIHIKVENNEIGQTVVTASLE